MILVTMWPLFIFTNSFYTNSGHILDEAISKELNDNEKSEVSMIK